MIKNNMMGGKTERTGNGGFTMVETLVAVSIIIILLAIGMAGILRYRDYLRITELDNMARSIYMAAQNRAVLLDNDRRFQTLIERGTPQADGTFGGGCTEIEITLADSSKKSRWYIDSRSLVSAAALDDLLPSGTIDPALRKGRFYIVYESDSASVTDVFYVEKQDYELHTAFSGIAGALEKLGADDKREARMKNKPMVGWFGSDAAAPRDKQLLIPEPDVEILIINRDELTLQVKYKLSSSLPSGMKMEDVTRVPSVMLEYKGQDGSVKTIDLLSSGRLKKNGDITFDNVTEATYTWVLDSLDGSNRFKDLAPGLANLGGEFTVTAGITLTAPDCSDSSYYVQGTDNSLFAKKTENGSTAYIEYLRHLQNLDKDSKVADSITMAKQTKSIEAGQLLDNAGQVRVSPYEFTPIDNSALTSYFAADAEPAEMDSGPCLINGLKVTQTSAADRNGAGLFSEAKGTNANVFQFQNVRLVNPDITGNSKNAGALAGDAANVRFENCEVASAAVSSTDIAGGMAGSTEAVEFIGCTVDQDEKTGSVKCDIRGAGYVGGLAGYSTDSCLFKDCRVANTDVSGTVSGGMAGHSKAGLFSGCRIAGVKVKSTGNGSIAGGMAGSTQGVEFKPYTAADGTVTNCTVEGATVIAEKYAGGMVGADESSANVTFTDCMVGKAGVTGGNVTVTATTGSAGGMSGSTSGACLFNGCQVVGTVVEGVGNMSIAGGMSGNTKGVRFEPHIAADGVEKSCIVENVTVTAGKYAGGMSGYNEGNSASFQKCRAANSTVTSADGIVGGMAGADINTAIVSFENCGVESITVESTNNSAGGLLGCTEDAATTVMFTDCMVGKAGDTGGNVSITTTTGSAGGMSGSTSGACSFNGCQVVGTVVKGIGNMSIAGGMSGNTKGVRFEPHIAADGIGRNCTVENVTVTAGKYAGGMAGYNEGTTEESAADFKTCLVVNTIVNDSDAGDAPVGVDCVAGGMMGADTSHARVSFMNCGIEGTTVKSTNKSAGGLLGYKENTTDISYGNGGVMFSECTAGTAGETGIVISGKENVGGLLGYTETGVTAVFADCTVGKTDDSDRKVTVTTSEGYAGGMAGLTAGDSYFTGCQVVGSVVTGSKAGSAAGGMAGCTAWAAFKTDDDKDGHAKRKCMVENVIVTAKRQTGGMAGIAAEGYFEKCEVTNATVIDTGEGEKVTDNSFAGGIVGSAGLTQFIDCIAGESGEIIVAANGLVGGIAGNAGSLFRGCKVYNATVEGRKSGSYAGGLAGDTGAGEFTNCIVGREGTREVTVTAGLHTGGLTGMSWGGAAFEGCQVFNAGINATDAGAFAGGITGASGGTKIRFYGCYVRKITVTSSHCAGGMAGHNWGSTVSFENCNAEKLTVKGAYSSGGLLAYKGGPDSGVTFDKCTVGQIGEGTVAITGGHRAGGLLGYVDNQKCKAVLRGCQVFNARVESTGNWDSCAGGLAGKTARGSEFTDCVADGEIMVNSPLSAGGLSGYSIDSSFIRCKAVNATVTGSEAGGLVGRLINSTDRTDGEEILIDGCQVYWTKDLPGAAAGRVEEKNCKIKGTAAAGGLVGEIQAARTTIQRSFAATLVYGEGYIGGLIGQYNNPQKEDNGGSAEAAGITANTTIENSYADCYLVFNGARYWPSVGGLIGLKQGSPNLTLRNAYAAGFITIVAANGAANAWGLCGGWSSVPITIENVYTAMYYDTSVSNITIRPPLSSAANGSTYFYLRDGSNVDGLTYEEMCNINMGNAFEEKTEVKTHPYNIDGEGRGNYPFPGLKDLDHYGDWVTAAKAKIFKMEALVTVSDNDVPAVSDNDMPAVSDNDAPAVSDNDAPAVSDNDTSVVSKDNVSAAVGDEPPKEKDDTEEGENPDEPVADDEQPEAIVPPENSDISGDADDEGGESESDADSLDEGDGADREVDGGGDTS